MYITALYPNIKIEIPLKAVREALDSNSSYNENEKDAIVTILGYTLRNSVVHYRCKWYQAVEGASADNPEVPSVANIFVKYVIDQKKLSRLTVSPLNRLFSMGRICLIVFGFSEGV